MKSATDIHGVTTPWRMLEGYQPLEGTYDEMVAAPGVLRPHCDGFVRSLEALGRHEFTSRWESAQAQHSRERRHLQRLRRPAGRGSALGARHGAAAHLARGMELASRAALIQRTRLLNLILADLYGPQTLLARRTVAAVARVFEPGLPAAVSRHSRPARDSSPPACRRSGALA